VIPKSIQLVAGRTGQEYNERKRKKGAFGEGRYHATAVETGRHLRQCLVYIDLNMVRAGVSGIHRSGISVGTMKSRRLVESAN
jgi:putative transposase